MINLNNKEYFIVTGVAGFIGYHLTKSLLASGHNVLGLDNMNSYYDIKLKEERLSELKKNNNFIFLKVDIADKENVFKVFMKFKPKIVINLAAQAGVRYSLENPDAYIESNINGFFNILEACRNYPVKHLIYASSSSVYGNSDKVPFKETDNVDKPISLYAATKKSNELMASSYSHLYNIPATGLRFFTVYGPLGRPDMAYYKFVENYFKDEKVSIYNNGNLEEDLYRDFTYIDDIVQGIELLIENPPLSISGRAEHSVYNLGNNKPEKLMFFVETLEKCLSNSLNRNIKFEKKFEPIKPGDVPATYASIDSIQEKINFSPSTTISDGLQKFTDWYVEYHGKNKN